MKFFKDFKAFISRGNVMDMAVGVIVGGAFSKIVTSLVNDIIMPLIALAMGGKSMSDLSLVLNEQPRYLEDGTLNPEALLWHYGNFIQTIIDFLIIALSVFIMIRVVMHLRNASEKAKEALKKQEEKQAEAQPETPPAPPAPTNEEKIIELLGEISASLKNTKTE